MFDDIIQKKRKLNFCIEILDRFWENAIETKTQDFIDYISKEIDKEIIKSVIKEANRSKNE